MKAFGLWRLKRNFLNPKSFSSLSLPKDEHGDSTTISILHRALQCCANARDLRSGRACHALAFQCGLREDTSTSNMLISMYSRCGIVECAHQVFDRMLNRSLISWNAVIDAYIKHGDELSAVGLFLNVLRLGFSISEYTLSTILTACERSGANLCKQLHSLAVKSALNRNLFVGTSLLDAYSKNHLILDALRVFEAMESKNDITWSSMITGLVHNNLPEQAISLFSRSKEFFEFSFSSALSACASMAAMAEGRQLHSAAIKTGFLSNPFVSSSLIDMYSRCGIIWEAYELFKSSDSSNLVIWNSIMSGFARHSRPWEALILFEKLQQKGLFPDEVTHLTVLYSCGHTGLVSKAKSVFADIEKKNKLHYSCMVDVLGRAGMIQEAYEMIETVPFEASGAMWGSLLSCCRVHGDMEMGKVAAGRLIEIEPDNAGNYILLCHMYAANGEWEDAARMWKFLQEREVRKKTGESWIEVMGEVHVFSVGERNHGRIGDVVGQLRRLQEGMRMVKNEFHFIYVLCGM